MGDNTLVTVTDGNTIKASDTNQYKTALVGDLIPRATDGTKNNGVADFGGSSNKFKDGYFSGTVDADTFTADSLISCPNIDAGSSLAVGDFQVVGSSTTMLQLNYGTTPVGSLGKIPTETITSVNLNNGYAIHTTFAQTAQKTDFTIKTITITLSVASIVAISLNFVDANDGSELLKLTVGGSNIFWMQLAATGTDSKTANVFLPAGNHTIILGYTSSNAGSGTAGQMTVMTI